MKRVLAGMFVVCLGISWLGAAGSSESDSSDSLVLMASQNWIKDIDRELYADFEQETGIKVQTLVSPDSGYETFLGTALSGASDTVDIFMYSGGNTMVNQGIPDLALDLTGEEWIERYQPWALEAGTYRGMMLGFNTWGIDLEGVVYNKTYFEANGLSVPTTWNDFIQLCEDIAALGTIPFYENINGGWHGAGWVYAMTPVILDRYPNFYDEINDQNSATRKKMADYPEFSQGIQQIEQFFSAKDAAGRPRYFTNDGKAEDFFGAYPAMKNADNVMMFTYSAMVAESDFINDTYEYGMFPLPILDNTVAVSNGGGIAKYINKNSNNIDAAKLLFAFLARPENLERYYAARRDLVSSAFIDVKSVSATEATADMWEHTSSAPVVMMLKDMLFFPAEVTPWIQGFIQGSKTANQFVADFDSSRETIFSAGE